MGKPSYFQDEIASTNQWATSQLQKEPVSEGTLFRAGHQTAGKGQRGNEWNSLPKQNLLLSYVLRPNFLQISEQFRLTMAISLGIKEMLTHFFIQNVRVKWPNDIYVNDQKIAGVLIEASSEGTRMSSTVVGIGLNVNQRFFSPAINATSMLLETGTAHSPDEVLEVLNQKLEKWYLKLRGNSTELPTMYTKALYSLNKNHAFVIDNERCERRVVGVNKNGQLLLADEYGVVQAYHLFQVKMLF
jgi:BirA family biotin operon repressor/biotin-[acetyl-CoA-carboxylase] ligase